MAKRISAPGNTPTNCESPTAQGGGAPGSPQWRAAALIAIGVTLLLLHLTNPHVGLYYGRYESAYYVSSVDRPLQGGVVVDMTTGDSAPAPVGIDPHYGYRLLPPLLVKVLPVEHSLGFVILDYVFLFGAAYLLYAILVHGRIRYDLCILCSIVLIILPFSTKWMLFYSAGPDPLHVFNIAAAYRCIQLRKWLLFSFILMVGTLTKETIWLMWVVALIYGVDAKYLTHWRAWLNHARILTIIPSLLVFSLIRFVWPADSTGYAYLVDIYNNIYRLHIQSTMWPHVLPQAVEIPASFFLVYGVIGIISIYNWRRSIQILQNHPAMLLFLVGSMVASVIGSVDLERCMFYHAIPVLYVFARVVQEQWVFFRQWQVAVPVVAAQAYMSDLVRWNMVDYERTYSAHYMGPTAALHQLVVVASAALLVVALRTWFGKRDHAEHRNAGAERMDVAL
ncbi:MAG: hypothetical protein ACRDI2_02170 [Chloroflexota bacterium]